MEEGKIIFPYQEAEFLRAIRYLSTLSDDIQEHAWSRLIDANRDRYLRMQASYLLARTELSKQRLNALLARFEKEADPYVQVAMSLLLVQRKENNQEIIRSFVFHPNEKVRNAGKFYRSVKNDLTTARDTLRHAFRPEIPWILCDNMPLIHLMAASVNAKVRALLVETIREPRLHHPIGGLREPLKHLFTTTRQSLMAPT
jgi:CII-binding regulator of phage lambda lysogenization HflD